MHIVLIADPPAGDKVARKFRTLEDFGIGFTYHRNAAHAVTEIPKNGGDTFVFVMGAAAGGYGSRIKALAREAGAHFVQIPPSWSGTLSTLENLGISDKIIGQIAAYAAQNTVGARISDVLRSLGMVVEEEKLPRPEEVQAAREEPPPKTEEPESPRVAAWGVEVPATPPEPEEPAPKAPAVDATGPIPRPAFSWPKGKSNPGFVAGRAEIANLRREQNAKANRMIVEFIRMRNGDVSSDEIAKLMRASGMPYNSKDYAPARYAAGFATRKVQLKNLDSRERRQRDAKLAEDWRDLLLMTPEEDRPFQVHSLSPLRQPPPPPLPAPVAAPPPPPAPAPVVAPPAPVVVPASTAQGFDLRSVPTEALLAEVKRRRDEARAFMNLFNE